MATGNAPRRSRARWALPRSASTLIADDTGFLRDGDASACVARQYTGTRRQGHQLSGQGVLAPGLRLCVGSVRLERRHVRQARLAQREMPVAADRVGTVGDHRSAAEARRLPVDHESGSQLRFRTKGRIRAAAGEVMGGGVRSRVQRAKHTAVGPNCGHRDDAIVRLAQPAQPLPAHMRSYRPGLAVTGIVDHDHPAVVRSLAGCSRSSSSRRSLACSPSQGDSNRKNYGRCTPGIRSPGASSPVRDSR
ncbi:hypothetical protein HLK59_35510 [Streptomyces sp. S3(2020)]|nr:hypothetical protein [Streptomyces sp. S3(2020)]